MYIESFCNILSLAALFVKVLICQICVFPTRRLKCFVCVTSVTMEKVATRVNLLDAADLDSEIHRILKDQVVKTLQVLPPGILDKWEPEIEAILRCAVWKLSLCRFQGTFGQQMLSIKYAQNQYSPFKANMWALLTIVSQYLKDKMPNIVMLVPNPDHKDMISRVADWLDIAVRISGLANFIVFLQSGVYPTLADRLVGLKPVSITSSGRVVGYSYMTRELLWHGFVELIVFVLPLVNYKYLQRRFRNFYGKVKDVGCKQLVYNSSTRCAICQEPPVLPYHMGCAHAYCYYCIQSNTIADGKFECPSCGFCPEDKKEIQPVTSTLCKSSEQS